jgi:putative flippase GtrA
MPGMYSTMHPDPAARPGPARASANHSASTQLLRFVAAGGVCTLLQYLVLVLGVELGIANAMLASGAGYVASSVLNYALNRRYTFGGAAPHQAAATRFIVVTASGLALNLAGMRLLHAGLHWHYLYAQMLVTLLVLLWNFAWHRHWTFAAPLRRPPGN